MINKIQTSLDSKNVRVATNKDMDAIKKWLDDIDTKKFESLRVNWNLTEDTHKEYAIFVYVDPETNNPIGYLWPDFGILEVKPTHRRKGIGKALVNHGLNHLLETGDAAITIQCAPESSIPFWKKMGFEFYTEDRAYKVIPKILSIPVKTKSVEIKILFYPESRMWDTKTSPLEAFSPKAFIDDKDGKIHLSKRITICTSKPEWNRDPVVSIYIQGIELYTDKAKRPEASLIGIKNTGSSYSIETIDSNIKCS